MGKVTASLFLSLDGVTESPEKWHFPYFNEEMGAAIGAGMSSADAFLLGRRTYEEWAAHWPAQSSDASPLADVMNGMRKYVVSGTLERADWRNSVLLGSDAAAAVSRLKQGPEDVLICGSATLVRSLLAEGLLDELQLMLHPVVVGSGGRLFDTATEPVGLELAEAQTFSTGVLLLSYRPAAR